VVAGPDSACLASFRDRNIFDRGSHAAAWSITPTALLDVAETTPAGVASISRGLSEAIPPVRNDKTLAPRQGCQQPLIYQTYQLPDEAAAWSDGPNAYAVLLRPLPGSASLVRHSGGIVRLKAADSTPG
jgi:hypothetical protein